jgi:hypothetical protein
MLRELKKTQALALLALIAASYQPPKKKAWHDRGIIGDLTWGFKK